MFYIEGTIVNIKLTPAGVSRKTGEQYSAYSQIQIQHQTEFNGATDVQIENIKTNVPEKVRPYLGKSVFLPVSVSRSPNGTYINHLETADIRQVTRPEQKAA